MDEHTEARRGAEVVVGTDGSATALRAVAWAATEARLRGLVLRIVHVAPYADTAAAQRHATAILGRALAEAHRHERHATVTTALLGGDPARTLVETARCADLLVVGMLGEHAGDALVASLATSVAAKADCPVTVVRGPRRIDTASLPVVLAVADPEIDSAAVEFAFTDADRRGGSLVVLHVAPGPRGTSVPGAALAARLQPWHDRYPTVPVEVRVEHGPVVEALLGATVRARMVVAGTRGRGPLTGAVLGSTSRALVKLGMCPVTIVPRSLTVAEVVGPTSIPEAVR